MSPFPSILFLSYLVLGCWKDRIRVEEERIHKVAKPMKLYHIPFMYTSLDLLVHYTNGRDIFKEI